MAFFVDDIANGIMGAISAGKVADVQKRAADEAMQGTRDYQTGQHSLIGDLMGQQRGAYSGAASQALGYMQPYAQGGQNALAQYMQTLLNPQAYQMSPAAQWQMGQGMQAINAGAAARGGMTGNTLAALNQYGQGVAAQDYGQRLQQLLAGSGMGQQAGRDMASIAQRQGEQLGSSYGQQLGSTMDVDRYTRDNLNQLIAQKANAEAAGITGTFGAMQGMVSGLGQSAANLFSGGFGGLLGGK